MSYRYLLLCLLFNLIYLPTKAQLLSYELMETHSIAELQQLGNNLGILPILMNYDYALNTYKVRYETPDGNGQTVVASGALIIPQNNNCALPLISYQHGTIVDKESVPSFGSGEVNIGLLYGTNGYFIAMPDYVGLGDSPGLHPYVHARTEASAVIDMLRASKAVIAEIAGPVSEQLFLMGYSQGGHATMAAHKIIQEELNGEMVVTASNPMSGPYDVSGIQTEVIIAEEPYPSPGYLPYLILAYQQVYGNLYNDLSEVLVAPYDQTIPLLFDGTNSLEYINTQVPAIPNDILQDTLLENFKNNPNHPFRHALRDNDLYNWIPTSPLRMTYCMGDDQISYQNSVFTLEQFTQNGATDIEVLDLGNETHGGCASPALISGLFYFNQFKIELDGLEVQSSSINGETAIGASDGSISVEVNGGVGDLQFSWSNGAQTQNLDGLEGGDYTLTITDANGCFISATFEVPAAPVAVQNIEGQNTLLVFPNPAQSYIELTLEDITNAAKLLVWDAQGKSYALPKISDQPHRLDCSQLPSGLYWLECRQKRQVYYSKFVVQ